MLLMMPSTSCAEHRPTRTHAQILSNSHKTQTHTLTHIRADVDISAVRRRQRSDSNAKCTVRYIVCDSYIHNILTYQICVYITAPTWRRLWVPMSSAKLRTHRIRYNACTHRHAHIIYYGISASRVGVRCGLNTRLNMYIYIDNRDGCRFSLCKVKMPSIAMALNQCAPNMIRISSLYCIEIIGTCVCACASVP